MPSYEVKYKYGYLQENPLDFTQDFVAKMGHPCYNPYVRDTIVIADTLIEAIGKVYNHIGEEEGRRHVQRVAEAKKNDTFPPEPYKVVVTELEIKELHRQVIK